MVFTELRFLLFFLLAFSVFWALPHSRPRKLWLLATSYGFYAAWDWRFLSLIVVSTLVDYLVGRAMERRPRGRARRPYLLLSLVTNLGILGFFKYFNFFVESAASLTTWLGLGLSLHTLEILLPLGISFYTFQTLSYSIDIYRGQLQASRSLLDVAVFVAFFPQLVAGPIVRASQFLPQLKVRQRFAEVAFRAHLTLFLVGYIKKACIGDRISEWIDPVYANPELFTALSQWLAALLYSVQIYCDFSGYSDMAIASAGLLGFRLTDNFRHPYVARSIQDLWRRWHISLTTWFRDYVYLPLSLSRWGRRHLYLTLLVTWSLVGLWHGADWSFIVWGTYHGLWIVTHRAARPLLTRVRPTSTLGRLFWGLTSWAATYWIAMSGLILFRAANLGEAGAFVAGLFQQGVEETATVTAAGWILIAVLFALHWSFARRSPMQRVQALPLWGFSVLYGAAWALTFPWAVAGYKPFIYFQF